MTRLKRSTSTLARAVLAASMICGSLTHYSALAAPTLPEGVVRTSAAPSVVTARSGSDRVRLETFSPSIPAGEDFSYTARVTLRSPAERVQMRFRVRHPSGRLIFQRTRIFDSPEAGSLYATFERPTDDLGLRPGVFPVELEVLTDREGAVRTAGIAASLLVFDGSAEVLSVVPVARVNGQPLSDASGRFVADPERFTRARDDVRALSSWVLANGRARITMVISPLLLEEWRSISDGYELVGPEGITEIGPESAVAREYAAALRTLQSAMATGRLELTAAGYSDPDLSALADADLLEDVVPQYQRGAEAVRAALETEVSTGSAPAGGCVPPSTAELLRQAGVAYVVVDSACTRSGDATASASSYRTSAGLVALVPDDELSAALASGDASAAVGGAFQRTVRGPAHGPLVIRAQLGAGGSDVPSVTGVLESLLPHDWMRLSNARDAAAKPRRSLGLTKGSGARDDPSDYWSGVRSARRWAGALTFALGDADESAMMAQRSSLIAQCAAWAGPDGGWALADRGRSFSDAARRVGSQTLEVVEVSIQPVTLPGSRGNVPITIENGSERTLRVLLEIEAEGGLRVGGGRTRVIELGPKETFLELPVDLGNSLSGRLSVTLTAGDAELDEASVTLKASYLDRIATVAGILLLLVSLLVFIIRRVRAAEAQASGASAVVDAEAYTERERSRRDGGRA